MVKQQMLENHNKAFDQFLVQTTFIHDIIACASERLQLMIS